MCHLRSNSVIRRMRLSLDVRLSIASNVIFHCLLACVNSLRQFLPFKNKHVWEDSSSANSQSFDNGAIARAVNTSTPFPFKCLACCSTLRFTTTAGARDFCITSPRNSLLRLLESTKTVGIPVEMAKTRPGNPAPLPISVIPFAFDGKCSIN